jgi:hypothetical protein
MDAWNKVDNYLIQVDTYLCSEECPCRITNTTSFTSNSYASPYYLQWRQDGEATAFQNCTAAVQAEAVNNYKTENSDSKFNANNFADYWAFLEEEFECAGFCQTKYDNAKTGTVMEMFKYQFTDINRLEIIF